MKSITLQKIIMTSHVILHPFRALYLLSFRALYLVLSPIDFPTIYIFPSMLPSSNSSAFPSNQPSSIPSPFNASLSPTEDPNQPWWSPIVELVRDFFSGDIFEFIRDLFPGIN